MFFQLFQAAIAALNQGPFLQEDVLSFKGLEFNAEQAESAEAAPDPVMASPSSPAVPKRKPTSKKLVKPKWLKV
ncbi:hypothetical protein Vadar_008219 [Vaccinium darrowii]|uniref:Uncharacterized protein n=1 Tax=Vaccinium darrowii TaxID=229202 RepID=A0ACB7XY06_9ERIC|nr:hypothetical protein Vadar_008219 [Vaccinium darrowii]